MEKILKGTPNYPPYLTRYSQRLLKGVSTHNKNIEFNFVLDSYFVNLNFFNLSLFVVIKKTCI